MERWLVGEAAAVVVRWLSQWNRDGPSARSEVRVEGENSAAPIEQGERRQDLGAHLYAISAAMRP